MDLRFSLYLPRDEASVPIVRRLCRGVLGDLGVSEGCVEDIALALTEACTNVLKHTNGQDGEYRVDIEINESMCEVSVVDAGRGFDYGSATHEVAVPAAESGRGLHLMSVLADDLKFTSTPGVDGTVVHLSKSLDLTDRSVLNAERFRLGGGLGAGSRLDAHLY